MDEHGYTSARDLFADCAGSLRVRVVPTDDMGGYEVVLTSATGFKRPEEACARRRELDRAVADVLAFEEIRMPDSA